MKLKALLFAFLLAFALSAPLYANDSVNINTATVKELVKLKGIGDKIAEKIVAYREANGPFKTVEDLAKVSGISTKTIEKNKDMLTVGEKAEPKKQ